MLLLNLLCFHWPLLMVAVFVLAGGGWIQDKGRFCIYGVLTLYGISRLISADVLPTVVGLLPNPRMVFVSDFETLHWIFQFGAAVCGVYALLGLEKLFQMKRVIDERSA
jgi:hypothetical protein